MHASAGDYFCCRLRRKIMNIIDELPIDAARHRILDSASASKFWGVSLPHWRRLYRDEKVPRPLKIGDRKLGWQLGALIDALEARSRGDV
jgi:predicted DNA-binding transcriptional regulator AlpA